eukprot:5385124-Lingulodinium_polyedra.AAC.1
MASVASKVRLAILRKMARSMTWRSSGYFGSLALFLSKDPLVLRAIFARLRVDSAFSVWPRAKHKAT